MLATRSPGRTISWSSHAFADLSHPAMTDLTGRLITCEQVLDRVAAEGAFVVFRDSSSTADDTGWQIRLRDLGRGRGIRLTICEMGNIVLIGERRSSVVESHDDALDTRAAAESRSRHPSRGTRLRLVRDDQ